MSGIITEIIKVVTDTTDFKLESVIFASVKKAAVESGGKEQYYGINSDDKSLLLILDRSSVFPFSQ